MNKNFKYGIVSVINRLCTNKKAETFPRSRHKRMLYKQYESNKHTLFLFARICLCKREYTQTP